MTNDKKEIKQVGVALSLIILVFAIQSSAQTLTSFDAPGAGTVPDSGTGTTPTAINGSGMITGYVVDDNYGWHGFVLGGNSKPIVFDVPGANPTQPGGTTPMAINDNGDIAGYFAVDTVLMGINGPYLSFAWRGFLRKANGQFTIFNGPNDPLYFMPIAINNSGVVAGTYDDTSNSTIDQAFYISSGTVTSFMTNSDANAVNILGTISGVQYTPTSNPGLNVGQGFLLSGGKVTTFQVPTVIDDGISNALVNDSGVVAGTYSAQHVDDGSSSYDAEAGFLRTTDGKFQTFAAPAGSTMDLQVYALNNSATVTGWSENDEPLPGYGHAFVRNANGSITVIGMPGEDQSAGTGINSAGTVVGWWESDGVTHGFIWEPSQGMSRVPVSLPKPPKIGK